MNSATSSGVDILNSPVVFKIAEKEYKLQRPSFRVIRAEFEKQAIEEYIHNIQILANTKKEGKERDSFLIAAAKRQPKGTELDTIIAEILETEEAWIKILYSSMVKNNAVSLQEVESLSKLDPIGSQIALGWIMGIDKVEDKPVDATSATEKKDQPNPT
jgi:hypothetical protein